MLCLSTRQDLNRDSVETLISSIIAAHGGQIMEMVVFSDDPDKPYGREVLFQDAHLELLVTGWKRGRHCWPHTHGPSSEGTVFVLAGTGTFQTFSSVRNGFVACPAIRLTAGQNVFVPRREIHAMGTDEEERLVCLHAYWPPVTEMLVYDPPLEHAWRVSGGGAWRPELKDILEHRSTADGM